MFRLVWVGGSFLLIGGASLLLVGGGDRPEEVLSGEVEGIEATAIPELIDLPQVPFMPTPEPTATPSPSPSPSPSPTVVPEPTATPDVWSPVQYEPLFSQYAGTYGIDKNTLERLANCESHFNPNAVSGAYVGMFQFGPTTWQVYRGMMGMDANPDLRLNAEESIRTAAYVISVAGTGKWPRCL